MKPSIFLISLFTLCSITLSTFASETSNISFSRSSGYCDNNFNLQISTTTPNGTIVYTLDGSNPRTSDNSITSTGPIISITIDPENTSKRSATPAVIIRASVKTGAEISYPKSRTFIFMDKVKTQQRPDNTWPKSSTTTQMMDYEMDAEIVNGDTYKDSIVLALLDLPTISVITDNSSLFDANTGIYVNAPFQGREWERECAIELLHYKQKEGFNTNAGLRIRGGASRKPQFPKHSFRVFFREEYGDKKLKYPLFGDDELSSFVKIDLSSPQSHSWSEDASDHTTFLRDIFAREAQGEAGQVHTDSRYYHLYLNGMYWGIYQTQERADANFGASYWGGNNEDYDVIKIIGMREDGSGTTKLLEASDGTMDKWEEIYDMCNDGFESNKDYYYLEGKDKNGQRVHDAEVYVDIDNLIDYMLNIFYTGNYDASPSQWTNNRKSNNMVAITNREDRSQGFRFIIHDAEYSLFVDPFGPGVGLSENRVDLADRKKWLSMRADDVTMFHIQWLHHKLSANEEYRLRFSDRAYEQLTENGIFTPGSNLYRFNRKAKEIETAIIAESARWGDGNDGSYAVRTKHNSWLPAINQIRNDYFPYRTDTVIMQLAEYDLFPSIGAPHIIDTAQKQLSGNVELLNTTKVIISNTHGSGDIYYTTDGTDPRAINGTISPAAEMLNNGASLTIDKSTALHARIKSNNAWGALRKVKFLAPQTDFSHFKVTELNYHPSDEIMDEDTLGAKKYEFIEFKNTSETDYINLSGLSIDSGINYTFPDHYLLAPKEYFVVASKPRYFYERYGVPASGNFSKNLSNSSEKIVINNNLGETIMEFTYSDEFPWPTEADGQGPTLSSMDTDPTGNPNESAYWGQSSTHHGTPFSNEEAIASLEESPHDKAEIFPNPTNGVINIKIPEYSGNLSQAKLYDINGRLVYETKFMSRTSVQFNSLKVLAGFYFLKINSGDLNETKKVVYTPR